MFESLSLVDGIATVATLFGDVLAILACGFAMAATMYAAYSRASKRHWLTACVTGGSAWGGMLIRPMSTIPIGSTYGFLHLTPTMMGTLLIVTGICLMVAFVLQML